MFKYITVLLLLASSSSAAESGLSLKDRLWGNMHSFELVQMNS